MNELFLFTLIAASLTGIFLSSLFLIPLFKQILDEMKIQRNLYRKYNEIFVIHQDKVLSLHQGKFTNQFIADCKNHIDKMVEESVVRFVTPNYIQPTEIQKTAKKARKTNKIIRKEA